MRDKSHPCGLDALRQATIWPAHRVLDRLRWCEAAEIPTDFHATGMVRQRLVRGSGKSRSSYGW
jgi:hypothetical protein